MNDEVERQDSVDMFEQFQEKLRDSPNGEFFLPDVRFLSMTPEVARLHQVVSQLSYYFPEYSWETSDSLDPKVLGLRIRWKRKTPKPHTPSLKSNQGEIK